MTFKALQNNDIINTRTLLHEAIPLTGTILSGTYGTFKTEDNIKNYSHGMFQTVYDYPYLSSSANHIFDITVGLSTQGVLYGDIATTAGQQSKKKNIYNQMSQVLMGYDHTGSILPFDEDGDIIAGGKKITDAFVVPFSRMLVKDEIKKETFQLKLGVSGSVSGWINPWGVSRSHVITVSDVNAASEYRVNSPAGEYGILYATSSLGNGHVLNPEAYAHTTTINGDTYWYAGLLFYQAGVMVLTSSLFKSGSAADPGQLGSAICQAGCGPLKFGLTTVNNMLEDVDAILTGSQISASADYFRHRIFNMQFNNTTELNSTIYFCRANHNEFNYSSNPTYLSRSKIRVKSIASDEPVSYITTVGLYNNNNELLATAKLSEPLKKTPSNEFVLRVRLDY